MQKAISKARPVLFCVLCSIFLWMGNAQAQGQPATATSAKTAIKSLKNGMLVMRLVSNSRKIEALEKLVQSASSDGAKARYSRMLDDTRQETQNQNRWMVTAFQQHYSFSKVVFMYDNATQAFKSGTRKGIFLDPNSLEIDPAISLDTDTFFVAWYGVIPSDEASSVEGINVADSAMQELKYPFPAFTSRATIKKLIERAFGDDDLESVEKLVIKFQKRLDKFYLQMGGE